MDKQMVEEMAIQEMAKIFIKASCKGSECEKCIFIDSVEEAKETCVCLKAFYNAGYRKIHENEVVIEKTEYDKLRLLADECLDWRRKCCNVAELPKENAVVLAREEFSEKIENTWLNCQEFTRKETAEKFKVLLKGTVPQGLLDEIAKEFKEGE